MGCVREFTTANGVRVRLMDDAYAGITEEELQERRRAVRRALDRIAMKAALRAAEAEARGEAPGAGGQPETAERSGNA